MEYQNTVKSPFTLSGRGLHTGQTVQASVLPAPAGQGVVFRRVDLNPPVEIPALASFVTDTSRGTTLSKGSARVATVEHLLSALHGLRIDNAIIEVQGEEIPILDGSAAPWVEQIKQAGIEQLDAERRYFTIQEPLTFNLSDDGVTMVALPSDTFQVTTLIDFKSKAIGQQMALLENYNDYSEQIAPCRTFCFLHEIEPLLQHNLIKGGDLDNALVFVDHKPDPEMMERLAQMFGKDTKSLRVKDGLLNTSSLHFPNEPARHKLLDFMGDISLVGMPIRGSFHIKCPGHKSNVEFAQLLRQYIEDAKQQEDAPVYDPNQTPKLDTKAIRQFLPYRYPFLMVDKIMELESTHVVGVKNVTINEPYFQGHFPDHPVLPGVLIIEAIGQVGGILARQYYADPENYTTVLAKVSDARFRKQVVPGDTLVMKVKLLAPLRRGNLRMKGTAYVGNSIVAETVIVAQIMKKEQFASNNN